jgi:hypothetical protein
MKRTVIWICCLLLWPLSAYAYIDPGTGMLLWQGLIALVGAVLVFVRHPIDAFKRLMDRLRNR